MQRLVDELSTCTSVQDFCLTLATKKFKGAETERNLLNQLKEMTIEFANTNLSDPNADRSFALNNYGISKTSQDVMVHILRFVGEMRALATTSLVSKRFHGLVYNPDVPVTSNQTVYIENHMRENIEDVAGVSEFSFTENECQVVCWSNDGRRLDIPSESLARLTQLLKLPGLSFKSGGIDFAKSLDFDQIVDLYRKCVRLDLEESERLTARVFREKNIVCERAIEIKVPWHVLLEVVDDVFPNLERVYLVLHPRKEHTFPDEWMSDEKLARICGVDGWAVTALPWERLMNMTEVSLRKFDKLTSKIVLPPNIKKLILSHDARVGGWGVSHSDVKNQTEQWVDAIQNIDVSVAAPAVRQLGNIPIECDTQDGFMTSFGFLLGTLQKFKHAEKVVLELKNPAKLTEGSEGQLDAAVDQEKRRRGVGGRNRSVDVEVKWRRRANEAKDWWEGVIRQKLACL